MNTEYKERIIFSIGGSLVVPNGGISTDFLKKLNQFIRKQLTQDPHKQFFLVIGGGSLARNYRDAGRDVVGHELTVDDLDWIGIHATKLNAHLVRTIFRDIAHPYVLKHYEIIRKVKEQVIVAAGWKPGCSTDYDAILLCQDYNVKTVINLSNIKQVFDRDPSKFPNAHAYKKMSWDQLRKIVGDTWDPGMHAPFDPIAAKKAQEIGVQIVVMSGDNFENVENYLAGKEFVGTIVE